MSDEGRACLLDAVGKREAEVGSEELLDVGAADIIRLRELNNAKDLYRAESSRQLVK